MGDTEQHSDTSLINKDSFLGVSNNGHLSK